MKFNKAVIWTRYRTIDTLLSSISEGRTVNRDLPEGQQPRYRKTIVIWYVCLIDLLHCFKNNH